MGRPQVTQHMRDEKGLEDKDHQQWEPGLKGAQRSGSGGKAETKTKTLLQLVVILNAVEALAVSKKGELGGLSYFSKR